MSTGSGGDRRTRQDGAGQKPDVEPGVADLFKRLNLTEEEGEFAAFSDDEDDVSAEVVQWAVIGKVLSPSTVHAATIKGAMTPAWGNPCGLKIRMVGEKKHNLFIAEFGDKFTMERALEGSPWLVGKYAVILRGYDDRLIPSEIVFDNIDLWVRILNLPLGWMNAHRGIRVMGLMGTLRRWMLMETTKPADRSFARELLSIWLSPYGEVFS